MQETSASSKLKDVKNLQTLEAQVKQLQSRLGYMEEEKGRLVAAAKGKNEQVSADVNPPIAQTVLFLADEFAGWIT